MNVHFKECRGQKITKNENVDYLLTSVVFWIDEKLTCVLLYDMHIAES